jgi:hypothetical protein
MASAESDMELTPAEQATFQGKKTRLFKATIAVNVIYGVIALSIFIAMLSNDAARELLTGTFAPFTITFMVGMFLIIIWLILEVYGFKPVKNPSIDRDPLSCPDYYQLERTPEAILNRAPADIRGQMQFRCVAPTNIFPAAQFTTEPSWGNAAYPDPVGSVVNDFNTKLTNAADKLTCKNIYPAYLHSKDVLTNKNETNKFRCEFIGKNGCNNVSWTSVCPHPR